MSLRYTEVAMSDGALDAERASELVGALLLQLDEQRELLRAGERTLSTLHGQLRGVVADAKRVRAAYDAGKSGWEHLLFAARAMEEASAAYSQASATVTELRKKLAVTEVAYAAAREQLVREHHRLFTPVPVFGRVKPN